MAIKTKEVEQQSLTATVAPIDMGFDASDFEQFDGNFTESSSIPYLQIQNPPNLSTSQLKQINPPYGLLLSKEQAELVGFTPNGDWQETSVTYGDGGNEVIVEGFITHHIRFAIIRRSNIEVQEKTAQGWRYIGGAYENGKATSYKELADSDRENHRIITRNLVLLLDADNNPMHSSPLQLTARGGFGGSIGIELKDFYKEVGNVFAKAAKNAGVKLKTGALDDQAKALSVFDAQLAYYKPEGKAPFVTIVSRNAPAIDQVGVSKAVKRKDSEGKDREITLTGVPLGNVLLKKQTETGKLILQLFEEYEWFAQPNAGRSQDDSNASTNAVPPTTVSGTAQGFWDTENDHRYLVMLKTDRGSLNLYGEGTIAQAIANILDNYEEAQGSFTCQKDGDWLKVLSFNLKDPMEGAGEEF